MAKCIFAISEVLCCGLNNMPYLSHTSVGLVSVFHQHFVFTPLPCIHFCAVLNILSELEVDFSPLLKKKMALGNIIISVPLEKTQALH